MEHKHCLRCDVPLQFAAHERLQLGETGWILGHLPNLLAGALEVDIFLCPQCRELSFFATEDVTEEDLPQKSCPVCGTLHDFDDPKCPQCRHDYFKK